MLAALSTLIIHLIQTTGYLGVFILMTLESALLPIPSEVTMPFAGYLAQTGTLSFPLVVIVGAVGNLVGSLVAYAIGYFLEEKVILTLIEKYGKFILLSKHEYVRAVGWYKKYGSGITFFSRLLPAVRTFISLPAGLSEMNIWKFAFYTFLGSLLWSFVLAYVGFYLGSHWDSIAPIYNKFQLVIVVAVILLVLYYIYRKMQSGKKSKNTII
ncbi:MAG TPA: DedA family protein [Candidatus Acidoferrales bacterium]|nr:DedA family protein [Candidatus Acidoferrales bacterium]